MARNRRLGLKKKFHAAIGKFIISWTELEDHLDSIVIALHTHPDTAKKELRHELPEKIALVRKQAPEWRSLQSSCDAIGIILRELEWFARIRNNYVHGVARGFNEQSGTIEISSPFVAPKSRHWKQRFTIEQINIDTLCVKGLKENLSTVLVLMMTPVTFESHQYFANKIYYDTQILDAESQMRRQDEERCKGQ